MNDEVLIVVEPLHYEGDNGLSCTYGSQRTRLVPVDPHQFGLYSMIRIWSVPSTGREISLDQWRRGFQA